MPPGLEAERFSASPRAAARFLALPARVSLRLAGPLARQHAPSVATADRIPYRLSILLIERVGRVFFYHYDPYAQALARIERGHAKDLAEVAQLLGRGLVEPQRLRELFEVIEPQLHRYPAAIRRRSGNGWTTCCVRNPSGAPPNPQETRLAAASAALAVAVACSRPVASVSTGAEHRGSLTAPRSNRGWFGRQWPPGEWALDTDALSRAKPVRLPTSARRALVGAFLLLAIVVVLLAVRQRYQDTELPTGCDEFGYLYLARAIAAGTPFETPTKRPFDPGLIDALKGSRFDFKSYMHLMCPHAYHLDPHALKVINQYPPGTPLLLGLLPPDQAKPLAPTVFAVFILLSLVLSLALQECRVTFFDVSLALVVVWLLLSVDPFRGSFGPVNSIAPTFGLLIGAGYLLPRKPGLSLVLLGLTTVFRIVNAILYLPLLLVFVLADPRGRFVSGSTLRRALRGTLLFVAGGLWIYGAYVWLLLGSPLRPTYSYLDRASTLGGFAANAAFYLDFHQPWFVLHVVLLALVTLLVAVGRMPRRWIPLSAAAAAVTYLFFLFHAVHTEYYPYAPAMVLLGLVLDPLAREMRKPRLTWAVPVAGALVLLVLARATARGLPAEDPRPAFLRKVQPYVDCYSRYDVVWAELRSGTVEYTTGKAGFRYAWGPPDVRSLVLKWLRAQGHRQAIWVSDLPVSQESVEEELQRFRIGYAVTSCAELGTVIDIPPRNDQ